MKKKGMIAVIITVIALFLVAAVLATVLVIRTARQLEDRWEARYEEEENEDENEAEETVAPATEAPAVEAPEETVPEEKGRLGLVLMHDPLITDVVADQFAENCYMLGYTPDVWVVTSDEPAEVFDISMMLIESGVDALAVECWDTDCLQELNAIAKAEGIPFVNVETPQTEFYAPLDCLSVCFYSRYLHVAPFMLGFLEQDLAQGGNFGVLKSGDNDPLYDSLKQHYNEMPRQADFLWTVDGYTDGSTKSTQEMIRYMLEENNLDALICTEPESSRLAAQIIAEMGLDVILYGVNTPAAMLDYPYEGLMFHHDTVAYSAVLVTAMDALASGTELEDGIRLTVQKQQPHYIWQHGEGYRVEVAPLVFSDNNIEQLAQQYR